MIKKTEKDNLTPQQEKKLLDFSKKLGEQFRFFFDQLNFSEKEKRNFLLIIYNNFTLEKAIEITEILRVKYLSQLTKDIDKKYIKKSQKIFLDYLEKMNNIEKQNKEVIEKLEKELDIKI